MLFIGQKIKINIFPIYNVGFLYSAYKYLLTLGLFESTLDLSFSFTLILSIAYFIKKIAISKHAMLKIYFCSNVSFLNLN